MSEPNEAEFQKIVEEAWDEVPEKFRRRIDNVALLIEDEPDEETRTRERLSEHETLLGLYHGIPESERGGNYGVGMTLPDTITLFRLPILDEADAFMYEGRFTQYLDAVQEAVRETLWHEVGHYFGLGEAAINKRERERSNRYHP